jgi:hypothetical protein
VTLIVFVPAGGTPDIIARLVGQALAAARPVGGYRQSARRRRQSRRTCATRTN